MAADLSCAVRTEIRYETEPIRSEVGFGQEWALILRIAIAFGFQPFGSDRILIPQLNFIRSEHRVYQLVDFRKVEFRCIPFTLNISFQGDPTEF